MPTNTHDSPSVLVQSIVTYAGLGAAWNVAKLKTRSLGNETAVRKVIEALSIGAIAGVIVALQGGEPAAGNFEKVMVIAVPIFDEILDTVRDAKRAYRRADDNDGERTDELSAAFAAATDNFPGEGEGEGEQ